MEVLNPGKQGFLGIGGELARVRVRKLSEVDGSASLSMEIVMKILSYLKTSANCTLRSAFDEESGGPLIDIDGTDSGLLIGRRGETLRAFQLLVNLIVNNKRDTGVRVSLDVEQYRARRDIALKELARKVAQRVATYGRSVTLEPMTPAERRVVHVALADDRRVSTESTGYGSNRRVTIAKQMI